MLIKGTFYLLVIIDTLEEPPMTPERFLGVDLGIVNLATDSTVIPIRHRGGKGPPALYDSSHDLPGYWHESGQTTAEEAGGERSALSAGW